MDSISSNWNNAAPADTALAIAILVASLWSFGYIVSTRRNRKDAKNNYPPFAPGSMKKHIQMCTSAEYPWWILDVARELNTRVFRYSLPRRPGTHMFAVGEPETVRSILADPLTTKPMHIYRHFARMGGAPTVFTTNGAEWHSKRKAVAPAFSSNQVKRMNRVAMDKTEVWIKKLLMKDNTNFDVAEEMIDVVLSAITETAFEYEMSKHEKEFLATENELALIEYTLKTPTNPLRDMYAFLLPERHRANAAVKNLVMASGAFPNDIDKAAQLQEFLIAGHETTSYSIAWILLTLAKHPEEQTKLRDALRGMSPENWSSCEQLQRCVKEGMRLHPVAAAGSIRTIGRDIITSKHELLPKGSICFMPLILMLRNSDVYDEADSFLPSRWENPSREMIDAFQPFSMGKQNCVGQSLAKAETFAIVAKIISELDLTVEDEGTVDFFLTLKPVGARLRARKI